MKDIQGYEGMYAVTSCGKVYSYKSKKFLKPYKMKSGYLQVSLCKNSKQKKYSIHRLVQKTYLSNPDNLPQVNHKDENKENNALPNLEWCDQKYNSNYGTHVQRVAKACGKPIYCIELNRTFDGARAAARELGLQQSNITQCCKGKHKTCGGYHWKYQEMMPIVSA